jgi:hypothetical protein
VPCPPVTASPSPASLRAPARRRDPRLSLDTSPVLNDQRQL